MEIINKILEWPVIVQGALGSFLFWLLFTISQKAFNFLNKKVRKEKELGSYFGRTARKQFRENNFTLSSYSFFVCIYASIHYFLKFTLTVFISVIVLDFIPIFAYVGYLIAIYFIFRALSYVTHFNTFEEEEEKNQKNKGKTK
jgi:hypothetical protein